MNYANSLLKQTLDSLGWLFGIIFLGLFLDSSFFSENYIEHSQWINNILVLCVFMFLYYKGTSRVKEQLIYAFLIGIIGEHIFSLGFGMYTYRLQNIPHYVPFGHAVVFLGVYYFGRKPKVRSNQKAIELFLTIAISAYALFFLLFKNDIFGFVMTVLVFISLRKYPKERLFYLAMFAVVVCVEIVGTSFDCWVWPEIAFDTFEFLPSANPPSGICLFYYGLDRGTMSIYKRRHKETWKRFKSIRAIQTKK
ncbi:hypothetical protein [Tenacibaculum sp. M341]|uniref:hypothetical protein n=1 Tax=Tenacibaculum sp. M341 TaxID=2530339 RepID=UPI00104EB1D8|nr:hypothetical protein [Tenacibaculum sp. M341]TCI91380.1 hypothetical protein EYW44_10510 [Tenacibaculum sp. M341]